MSSFVTKSCNPAHRTVAASVGNDMKGSVTLKYMEIKTHRKLEICQFHFSGATTPDVCLEKHYLARHMQAVCTELWKAVRYGIRHLKGFKDLGIISWNGHKAMVTMFCDANSERLKSINKYITGIFYQLAAPYF